MVSHSSIRTFVRLFTFALVASTGGAETPPYVQTAAQSRSHILQYCRTQLEENSARPRLPYRATFEKALDGDFDALDTIFTNETYHDQDDSWTKLPWHFLNVLGDLRFSDFLLSRPSTERATVPFVVPSAHTTGPLGAKFDVYFHKHFPRTEAIHKAISREKPEVPGVDYGIRHLSRALSAEPRFEAVHLSKRIRTGDTLITAPRSLSKKDKADLRVLIQKHLGGKAQLVFR